jgi:hypothetical protein
MALEECRECAKEFSTRASQCPHCGAKRTTLAAKGCLTMVVGLFGLLVIIGLLRPDDPPSAPPLEGVTGATPLTDCSIETMKSVDVPMLTREDMAAACASLRRSVHYTPTIANLQTFSKALVAFQYIGTNLETKEVAYQLANFIEARAATQEDPNALHPALDAAFRIYEGSEKRVTPKDLVVFLRSGGASTRKLSDDGLFSMAALMWESKKDNGE